ncbi:MAG: hypothetical protein ACEQSB_02270 [Undibacterium sp.]
MAMFEMFRRPKKVSAEPMAIPEPGKADQFVAAAKAAGVAPKKAETVYGRNVYSTTPVMSDAEAAQFGRVDVKAVEGNVAEAKAILRPAAKSEVHARITRAGYYDLDEQVDTVPPFSDSQGQAEKQSVELLEMTPEEMLAQRETLLQEIGGLRARQLALDDLLDAASIQELSQVNKELGGKEALLTDLEEALARGADSKQPGQ